MTTTVQLSLANAMMVVRGLAALRLTINIGMRELETNDRPR